MADINITETAIDINVTEQVIEILSPTGGYPLPSSVYSVFGRVGNVVAVEGDYTLTQLAGVTITSPISGQALVYNGTSWVNNTETYVGTVTSVAASVPTGLTISGSPITSNGTLAFGLDTGYVIPLQSTLDAKALKTITISTTAPITGGGDLTTNRTFAIAKSTTLVDGYLAATDFTIFNNKENAIDIGTTSQYYRGDKSFQTLNTTAVIEAVNLYYTDLRARGALSFAAGSGSYNSTTGVITIPTNNNQITNGAAYITLTGLSATTPLNYNNTTGVFSISQSNTSTNGYLSSTDWNTFNNKEAAVTAGTITQYYRGDKTFQTLNTTVVVEGTNLYYTQARFDTAFSNKSTTNLTEGTNLYYTDTRARAAITGTSPISVTSGVVAISQANTTTNGYLSFTDWNTFNGKQNALSGTGFVKITGTTISYDNSTYLTTIAGITAGGELSGTYASPSLVNSAVTGKILTGVNVTGGSISATDSILTAFGKVQNQINGLIGGSIYQGTWNANTNTPTLTSSVGTSGYYYIVSVAGATNLNGITDWQIGDWAIFNGGVWQKVDNTDAVVSVNGFTGAVSLVTTNINEGTNLYFTNARTIASILTGYTSGAGTITSSDTILTAIQKLNGNIGSIVSGVSSVFGRTGAVVANTGDYTTSQVTEGTNLYYTDTRARASNSFVAGSGAYNSTTGVITIPTNNNQITNGNSFIALTGLSAGAGISYNNTTGAIASTITQYTDALARLAVSLTTTGTSGAATYNSTTGVLNIPAYVGGVTSAFGRTGAVVATSGDYTTTLVTEGTNLYYTEARVSANTNVAANTAARHNAVTIGTANGLSLSTQALSLALASTSVTGALSSTDWTTFNNKQSTISLTTTGTSGVATFSANTLNIPNYGSALSGYLPLSAGSSFPLTGDLYIKKSDGFQNIIIQPTTTTAAAGTRFVNAGNDMYFFIDNSGGDYGPIGGNGPSFAYNANIRVVGNRALQIATNDTVRFTIASTGAATFSSSVTVNGGNILSSGSSYGIVQVKASASQTWQMFANPSDEMRFGISGVGDFLTLKNTGAATFSSGIATNGYTASTSYAALFNGSVGIGTTSPTDSIIGSGTFLDIAGTGGGALKLHFTNATAYGEFSFYKGSNGSYIDSAGAVTLANNDLIFRTGGTVSNYGVTERMRITSGGVLQMSNNSTTFSIGSIAGNQRIQYGTGGFTTEFAFIQPNDGYTPIGAGAFNTRSDYRLKEDLKEFNGLSLITDMKVYDFKWKEKEERNYGFMAHELQEVVPYVVTGTKDGMFEDEPQMQGLDYSKIVPVLVKAIQEQQAQIETQDAKIEELKALIAAK